MSGSFHGTADTGSFDLGLPNTEMGKVRLEQGAAAAVLQRQACRLPAGCARLPGGVLAPKPRLCMPHTRCTWL